MSWYKSTLGTFKYRHPISVNNVGGSAGSIDISILIPPGFGLFWDTIRSDGYDVVLTDADGSTILSFQRSGFTYASKALTLQVDAYSAPGEGTLLLWLYYGNADQTADLAGSGLTISSAKTGSIDQGSPVRHLVSCQPEIAGSTNPRTIVHKEASTQDYLFYGPIDDRILQYRVKRSSSDSAKRNLEEVDYVQFSVELATVEQAAMMDEAETRFCLDNIGRLYIKALIKAGTSGTTYTARVSIYTINQSSSRTILAKALIAVKSLAE